MRLSSFRVRKFRNVVDSGDVTAHEAVTCLVGKNEAGKSALLEALYLLNPVYESHRFDVVFMFPSWLLARQRRTGEPEDVVPISARFKLEDDEASRIEEALGPETLSSGDVTVSRTYGGRLRWQFDLDELTAVNHLRGENPSFPTAVKTAETFEELDTAVEQALNTISPNAPQRALLERISRTRLEQENSTVQEIATRAVRHGLPKFFRFSDYDMMKGVVDLSRIESLDTPEEELGEGGLQAVRALIKLSGSKAADLGSDNYELRKQELATVSSDLTHEVFEYWRQNPNLRVDVDIDIVEGQAKDGPRIVRRDLHIDVEDTRTRHTTNFNERSAGFKWFFSFFAAFSEFDGMDNVVVLLDEPGLNLHGKAQADFLRFIDERLSPAGMVMYTTHSPFMVPVDGLDRVRIVEDTGPDKWVQVSSDVTAHDPDSLFPLQGALGYDIAQSLFVGPDNLVVEGTSDFMYLVTLSDHLEETGRSRLDRRWRLLPAGGGSNVATFVSLIGPQLETTVLVDSGTSRQQRLTKAIADGLISSTRVIRIGDDVLGRQSADIEDLFSVSDYLRLFNGAFGTDLSESELEPGNRIVDRIERTRESYNHRQPALYLLREADALQFDAETLDNFDKLFNEINSRLS